MLQRRGYLITGWCGGMNKKMAGTIDLKKVVFEHIDLAKADLSRDHAFLHKTNLRGSLNKLVHEFTQEMLLIAELVNNIDPYMVEKLNRILEENGLEKVEHVLHAIYRLGDTFKTKQEIEKTDMALKKCFMEAGCFDEITAKAIRDQWPMCWRWKKFCVFFVHPPLQSKIIDLQELKSQIEVKQEYAEVCEAARFMVDLMIKIDDGRPHNIDRDVISKTLE